MQPPLRLSPKMTSSQGETSPAVRAPAGLPDGSGLGVSALRAASHAVPEQCNATGLRTWLRSPSVSRSRCRLCERRDWGHPRKAEKEYGASTHSRVSTPWRIASCSNQNRK
jgi:hypothetical protein